MSVPIREVEFDHVFAETIAHSEPLKSRLLAGGRFAYRATEAQLLVSEQADARRAKHWWKHWWCRLPDGTEGETDIFLVFETASRERFAVHIENKPPHGVLSFDQAARYRRRAAARIFDERWLNYSDFEVVLLAPQTFLDQNTEAVAQFDRGIAYEDICDLVPLFDIKTSRP